MKNVSLNTGRRDGAPQEVPTPSGIQIIYGSLD